MRKNNVRFLILGDVFGKLGRQTVKEHLSSFKRKYRPDLVIANVENITHGAGVSIKTLEEMLTVGVNCFTGGNHSLDNIKGNQAYNLKELPLIRPANLDTSLGQGDMLIQLKSHSILIINLLGQLFMDKQVANPFLIIDKILNKYSKISPKITIVDFHAETTSEKTALAYYLNGRVSLVYGTHTHVPTADERILDQGTGYISDVGFIGPLNSVIGVDPKKAIANFIKPNSNKMSIVETGTQTFNALLVDIQANTGQCTKIKRINKIFSN